MSEVTAAAARSGGPRLTQLLPVDAIRICKTAPDWRAAVRLAGDALVASGATTPAYTDEMVATVEQLGPYIVIAPGIALAHSRPSPAVLRAGISLVTLLEPVAFGHRENDPVRLVIGLAAVDEDGHITALSTLAELLSDETRREGLIGATGAAEVAQMVRSFDESQAVDAPWVSNMPGSATPEQQLADAGIDAAAIVAAARELLGR